MSGVLGFCLESDYAEVLPRFECNILLVCDLSDGCVQAASDGPIQDVQEGSIITEEKLRWLHRDCRERGWQA